MTMNATYSPDDNKLRLYSVSRLDPETYARVKAAGFKWAPQQKLFVAPMWTPQREDLLIELCGEIGDEDTTLTDRAEERAERFDDYSEKRLADAERARKTVAEIADNIPFGQPILVGHHSEKHARRDAEKIENGMRKAVKMWRTSQYWEARAAGAIRHAKYKELPAVRHRRIKGIESDQRKTEKTMKSAQAYLAGWATLEGGKSKRRDGTPATARDIALYLANGCHMYFKFTLADYPRDPPVSQYEGDMGIWSALDHGIITPQQARDLVTPAYERSIASCMRWLEHYANRLAYERTMLAEQIGAAAPSANPLADRFAFAVGGQVLAGRGGPGATWETVTKVNRGANGSVSSVKTTVPPASRARWWKVESIHDYRPPTAETVATAKAAAKLPPLCNYPGDGFAHMTQADYDKAPKDYRGYRPRAATETVGAHRTRVCIGAYAFRGKCDDNKRHSYAAVFITDAKRVDPPAIKPPSEPKEAAEFVREFVAPPSSATDSDQISAALALAEEIAAPGATVSAPDIADDIAETIAEAPGPVSPHVAQWANERAAPARPGADFEAMAATLRNGGVQVISAPQLFPTPAALAAEMVEIAGIEVHHRVLEPSAGTGAIWRELCGHRVAVEINARLAEGLQQMATRDDTVICADFLNMAGATPEAKFDRIVMNPPFERGADIRHIEHARNFLKPGGRLVAICANGPRQRERLQPLASEWRDLPAGTFKESGTMVNAALLVIDA